MSIYIGVDGGGTKTEVFVLDAQTRQAAIVTGSASNPSTVGWDGAVSTALQTIDQGLAAIHRGAGDIAGVSFCMSGIDRPEQIQRMTEMFVRTYAATKIEVVNDGLAALTAGTRGASGIVLIAGTGSIAVGESRDGQTARAGGYGSLIGDEGGGFDIGRQGLMAAIQYAEGRGQKTLLWQRAQEVFSVQQPGEMIPKIYNSNHPVGSVASFARFVLEASSSDECAARIVEESALHHMRMALSVRTQLQENLEDFIVLAGGLFTNTRVLRDRLSQLLRLQLPNVTCAPVAHRPSAGAALRAVRLVQGEFTPDWLSLWEDAIKSAEPS